MANIKFSDKTIEILSDNPNVTYISDTQINFTPEFKIEVSTCNSINQARNVFKEADIDIDLIGYQRFKSLYNRFKSQYRSKGSAAFLTESRGRKKIADKVTYDKADLLEQAKMKDDYIAHLEAENAMLKKFMSFLPKKRKKENKFNTIFKFTNRYTFPSLTKTETIKLLCNYLSVSVSGYYKHLKSKLVMTSKKEEDKLIEIEIIRIQNQKFRHSKSKYQRIGYRRMTMLINRCENIKFPVNCKRVLRLMKKLNLQSKYRTKKPYKNSTMPLADETHTILENVLDRNFDNPMPYNVLCTDITYLICNKMRAYMSAVKDATTGKILAYRISLNLKEQFVLDTINDIPTEMLNDESLIHSDRGSHYTSPQFRKLVSKLGLTQSMSRIGRCIDNAPIESFFGHLKGEVAYEDCSNLEELQERIEEYVLYYNYERPQFKKNKMTPHEVEYDILFAS